MTKPNSDLTPEEFAQKCLGIANGNYRQARALMDKTFMDADSKRQAREILDRWEREQNG